MKSLLIGLVMVVALGWGGVLVADDDTVVVVMRDMAFKPEEVTVQVGRTVRWENHERRQFHNVWFRELGEEPGEYLFPEESMERTFDEPGEYPYLCEPHEDRGMTGVIRVE
ncbi:cupredoxin domain-containing protein [Wenzhouxiangella sp. AB-CW3]|uniref:cupredoxin domain-containing protein n=1 Tax=Wenzhouxiangella sp. AB-CW3 TaxID=2771012 RepID=UPI00168B1DBF|nr:plastocyanin/azurin family copper-binding protein [Wenzhouxiangella sp. AB-CW3]QOC21794.1 cupredoxin domain-containing protein [Wenzhouxiangella sp. AB-CW3]